MNKNMNKYKLIQNKGLRGRHSGESRNPGQFELWVTWMPPAYYLPGQAYQVRHDGRGKIVISNPPQGRRKTQPKSILSMNHLHTITTKEVMVPP
jgi:hypothetical protein